MGLSDHRYALEAIARKRSPVRRFAAAAHAYLDFAAENPSRFRVMSLSELACIETPDGRARLEAAQASFALLVRLVREAGPP